MAQRVDLVLLVVQQAGIVQADRSRNRDFAQRFGFGLRQRSRLVFHAQRANHQVFVAQHHGNRAAIAAHQRPPLVSLPQHLFDQCFACVGVVNDLDVFLPPPQLNRHEVRDFRRHRQHREFRAGCLQCLAQHHVGNLPDTQRCRKLPRHGFDQRDGHHRHRGRFRDNHRFWRGRHFDREHEQGNQYEQQQRGDQRHVQQQRRQREYGKRDPHDVEQTGAWQPFFRIARTGVRVRTTHRVLHRHFIALGTLVLPVHSTV